VTARAWPVARLYRGLIDAMQAPKAGEKLENLALVPLGNTPAEFAALIPREIARMLAVLDELGLKRC
jgi:tripartite-type tricarboxylate transporter receptor subunit TctC